MGRFLDDRDPRHGTVNGYSNLGCRCLRCKKAWSAYHYERMRAVKDLCTIEGCEERRYAKGLCKPHYERKRLHRSLDAPVIPRKHRGLRYS